MMLEGGVPSSKHVAQVFSFPHPKKEILILERLTALAPIMESARVFHLDAVAKPSTCWL
jgi:hypothetical protein